MLAHVEASILICQKWEQNKKKRKKKTKIAQLVLEYNKNIW